MHMKDCSMTSNIDDLYVQLVIWFRKRFGRTIDIKQHCQMGSESYEIVRLTYNVITGNIDAHCSCGECFSMPHYVKIFHYDVYAWLIKYASTQIA